MSCCSATSACSNPTSTAASTSTAISPLAFRAGIDSGHDRDQESAGRAAQPLARVALLEPRRCAQAKANARFHYGLGQAFYEPWLDTPAHDVHLRLLERRHGHARGGAAQQDGPRLPQGAAAAGRDLRRRRLRLGRPAVPRVGALRRASAPASTRRPSRSRSCAPRSRAAASTTRCASSNATSATCPASTTSCCRSARSSTPGRDQLPEVVRAHADALKPGGLGVIHFIGHVGARDTEFFIRKLHLSGRLDPEPRAGARRDGALRARGARRREPAPPLRADARLLGRALRPQLGAHPRARPACASTSASAASGARTCGRARRCSARKDVQLNLFQVTVSKGNVGADYPMSRAFLYGPRT